MVCTRLVVFGTKNSLPFAKSDHVFIFQSVELPLYELIVVLVRRSGDKGSPPVNRKSDVTQVALGQGREILKSKVWVLEVFDLVLGNAHGHHNLVLFSFGRILPLQLLLEPLSAGLDRHSSAVKALGEEHIEPLLPLVAGCKFSFGDGKGVSEVQ